jgi:hypothetical protein
MLVEMVAQNAVLPVWKAGLRGSSMTSITYEHSCTDCMHAVCLPQVAAGAAVVRRVSQLG